MYTTDQYEGMLAETVVLPGNHADLINAYLARPLGAGPFQGDGAHPPHAGLGRVVLLCYTRSLPWICSAVPKPILQEGHGTPEDGQPKCK
jgi:hypothetical protein